MALRQKKLNKLIRDDFSGGCNYFLGVRQIADNESPNATNCDFKGRSGVGNRSGYTEIGTVAGGRTAIYGMNYFRTSAVRQAIKFASDGSDIELYYSTGGAWTEVNTDTFTDSVNMDTVQAGSKLYTANGADVMKDWSGAVWATTANGTKGYFPEYYDKRLWVVDETNADTVNFSGQYAAAGSLLGDFADASAGTVTFEPGSGAVVKGMKSFKNKLYVFLDRAIYRLSPASAANTFTVELVTRSVGCVSHRSIVQVGEDLFFAAYDGVHSLGEVANYTEVRTTNLSARMQKVFDNLSGANKAKLAAGYYNFKYHLFYSQYGTANDSCIVYDTRYKGWQDWTNIAGNDSSVYIDSNDDRHFYFGNPSNGEVYKMYSGDTDNGGVITSNWYSKSYDDKYPDTVKLYFDTTATFYALSGTVNFYVIFNDNEISGTSSITEPVPQGGYGSSSYGRQSYGDADNTLTVNSVINEPQRLRAKGKKFAIQYRVSSTGQWQLNNITQTLKPFSHYKFPSENKL